MIVNISHSSTISETKAQEYTQEVLKKDKQEARYHGYRYHITEKNDHTFVIFVNIKPQIESMNVFVFTSFGISVLANIILYFIVLFASEKAMTPMKKSIMLQKQFITDASHEIKTPLAIISANNEVLEMQLGESEWLKSNKKQIDRLNKLIQKLLLLSKMEEQQYNFISLNISETLETSIKTFVSLIQLKNINLSKHIDHNIIIKADKESIQTLLNGLLDNALKYTKNSNQIKITCKKTLKGCTLEFFNTCDPIDSIDLIFERFYRDDQSHSSIIEGQGIGLSIAKAIVDAHGGNISASNVENGLLIKIEL